ncbi:MAG: hypothetical protein QMD25_02955 [Caldisericia bacterium]|jgi:hypothetical protein|nr:hypothetical protein [Caldisericia bacterium]
MKRLINGITLSIIFGIIFSLLKNSIDKYFYLPSFTSLLPLIFLSYILILVILSFYVKNPIFGLVIGIFSLFSKYLTEITEIYVNEVPKILLKEKIAPPLNYENLNILLTPLIFSIISFLFSIVKEKKTQKIENPFISLILLISLFLGFFLNYYYFSYSIYILPLASFILGLISINVSLAVTSGVFFGASYTFFNLFFFEFKGDLFSMFENPIPLLPPFLIYLIFIVSITTLTSYPIYKILSYLKERKVSGKVERVEKEKKEETKEEMKETPALPQEEQSGNAKGGNDEKVRDDGDLQTKS